MNGNGSFVLGRSVAGNPYVKRSIQGMAGQEVVPEGFQMRINDPRRSVQVVVRGIDGSCQPIHLCYFSEHPPEETLRGLAVEF